MPLLFKLTRQSTVNHGSHGAFRDHGHSTSQYRLGEFYLHGSDVNHWIIHRRDTGMSNQQNRKSARTKQTGVDLPERPGSQTRTRKAILWYKEAAEQGYAHAHILWV